MQDMLETHRSFVNSWESDENDHMNVQFYFRRFDEAARIFSLLSAEGAQQTTLPRDRHVRYHAELHAGARTLVRSAVIAGGYYNGRVVHLLENAETGALAAIALEATSGLAYRHQISPEQAEAALPRSAGSDPLQPIAADRILAEGGLLANASMVSPAECDVDGKMNAQYYIARFSDAAPHVWACAGLDTSWLRERGLGRVAVEMKITHHLPARAGEAIALYSVPRINGAKTLLLRHEIVRIADREPIASGEVVVLMLDLKTRRSQALPDALVERMGTKPASD